MNTVGKKLILASGSPRRKELLEMLGFHDFDIVPARGEESVPEGLGPEEIVKALSRAKAAEVSAACGENTLVLAADTIVWIDGRMLGKPHSERDAFDMLKLLSGRSHEVYTGLTLIDGDGELSGCERSRVHFRPLTDTEILRYIQDGEPMDKAGAYGAQGKGALFVRAIEGDFFNVMGLPICLLGQMLARKGVTVL